ncbi:zinc finger matrin-type protein 5 [Cyprinus carpio]|uniref:Zinc finger matrin-type protein 5 n=1 Tax=Cyprinus carpio TaxID=7962 RepID=A0A9R0AYP7_CYPCA|nr:zinc finger matrin-type protein 5 [Cyprinus carpio]
MGKRYFCDYCDRSFQDNLHNRKKHLNGVQHHRAKKAWFEFFRFSDAATVLNEERTKEPCRKFLQTEGKLNAEAEGCWRTFGDPDRDGSSNERSIDEWLSRREKKLDALTSGRVLNVEEEECAETIEIPPYLLSIPDLPPSLHPPPTGGWRVTVHNEWG